MQNMTSENYVFACDGKTFNSIRTRDPELFKRIVHRGKVFARMLPDQKIELIECLKGLGRQVIMCGDGCNDCGALKTAHAGTFPPSFSPVYYQNPVQVYLYQWRRPLWQRPSPQEM